MELKCLKCGYEWKPVAGTGTPKQCPRCKRYDWNIKTGEDKKWN